MKAQLPASEFADAQLPQPGDVVAGKYRVDGFIARGGMGAVLSATHQITGRRMALKWVLPDPAQDAELTHRIVREAQAAARVRHPNVVDVYDVGEHDGSMFLVMELLEGETLHARLKTEGALDPSTTLALLLPALRAIETAHGSHVIHRDLKPSNIFLCRDSAAAEVTPRVLDFGISKILSTSGDGEHSLTRTGAVIGTPHYMAPEQLTGNAPDARADIYALGVILYRCLTGQLPFQDSNYNALVLQIATATPVPVDKRAPHVSPALSSVVMRAMARDADDRFPSVTALIAALLAADAPSASAQPVPAHASTRVSRRWLFALAACVLVAVIAWLSQQAPAPTAIATPTSQSNTLFVDSAPAASSSTPAPAPPIVDSQSSAPLPVQAVVDGREPVIEPATQPSRVRPRRAARAPQVEAQTPAAAPAPAPAPKQPVPISLEQF